jgi:hypothetical protein
MQRERARLFLFSPPSEGTSPGASTAWSPHDDDDDAAASPASPPPPPLPLRFTGCHGGGKARGVDGGKARHNSFSDSLFSTSDERKHELTSDGGKRRSLTEKGRLVRLCRFSKKGV